MTIGHLRSYATYLPQHRLDRQEIGSTLNSSAGRGHRVVASFDEDSTTMAVEACRAALAPLVGDNVTGQTHDIYFATTSPAYLDKTNASAVHAALGLDGRGLAADLAGSARSGIAALRAAAASGGIAAAADVRVGLPGSGDERSGADGAVAFVFAASGDTAEQDGAIAEVLAAVSSTAEVLDRWRSPARQSAELWEERFGSDEYAPLVRETAERALEEAGLVEADHVVLVSPNAGLVKKASTLVKGGISTGGSPVGRAGAADLGIALAAVLDVAEPGQSILALLAADGCDAIVLRTTDLLPAQRQSRSVAEQIAAGTPIPYATYLTWRGLLTREPPRRPEPDRPGAPPSARGARWKFGFTGSRCLACGFAHLPPARICRKCGAVDEMAPERFADATGTVATYTVDRLAFSPSPPLVDAVVDFAGGGRFTLEIADADPDALAVGQSVSLVFRRLFTAGGVHNYFWKVKVDPSPSSGSGTTEATGRN